MNRKCKTCGAEYEGAARTRLCPDCRQLHKKERQIKKRQEIKEALSFRTGGKRQRSILPKPCDVSQCRTCLYRLVLSEAGICCGYLYYTDKMRPSEPSPVCRAYEKSDKRKRAELLERVNSSIVPVKIKSQQERQYAGYMAETIKREQKGGRKRI